MQCPACRYDNRAAARFCRSCGVSLAAPQQSTAAAPSVPALSPARAGRVLDTSPPKMGSPAPSAKATVRSELTSSSPQAPRRIRETPAATSPPIAPAALPRAVPTVAEARGSRFESWWLLLVIFGIALLAGTVYMATQARRTDARTSAAVGIQKAEPTPSESEIATSPVAASPPSSQQAFKESNPSAVEPANTAPAPDRPVEASRSTETPFPAPPTGSSPDSVRPALGKGMDPPQVNVERRSTPGERRVAAIPEGGASDRRPRATLSTPPSRETAPPASATTPQVTSVPEPDPTPAPAGQPWLVALRGETERCATMKFLQRIVCVEKAKFKHCNPNRWNTVADCAVHRPDTEPGTQ